ncbi:hypothetical protein ACFP7A_06575 [Sporolactobacillus kofuensis]|uniref:DUF3899 domain-containing protein n=1 Tax=Sporolactobacillus kofuensis TaxID=269672 RepID=A0ABW1WCE3_9BACL|nr:hypothetical protein [Sporolactobacillus kofuensis]MCO7175429.1 hypothetical protein [Sporolactobacillus kofuensis]
MMSLVLAILFWVLGMILMNAGFFLTKKMREASDHLLEDAEHEEGKDNSASIARTIEGAILDHIPSYVLHLVGAVLGSMFFVIGFVALAFYFH